MANQTYVKAREAIGQGQINLLTADIRFVMVDAADYTINLTTHQYLSDIPGGAIVSTSATLTGKSISGGKLISTMASPGGGGVKFTAVVGDVSEYLIPYVHTGTAATSRLLAKIDTASNSTLPVTPNTSDIVVIFPDGEIFDL